jgi:trk system potassium uptake protein TrkA
MMLVIVVGGGKTGSHLASQLIDQGHRVKVIEERSFVIERLQQELPEDAILVGDGSSPSVLEAAGIMEAQVLAAVTGEDETNLVISSLGRFEYHVPRIIARVNNPKNAWLFNEEMGVDVALNQTDILAKLIAEEMSLGDMMTLLKLRRGEYAIVEEKVHPQALVVGKSLREITLPSDCVFVGVLRRGRLIVPHGETVLQPVDEVIALIHSSQTGELARLLGGPQ